jgi:hypothetical protein
VIVLTPFCEGIQKYISAVRIWKRFQFRLFLDLLTQLLEKTRCHIIYFLAEAAGNDLRGLGHIGAVQQVFHIDPLIVYSGSLEDRAEILL